MLFQLHKTYKIQIWEGNPDPKVNKIKFFETKKKHKISKESMLSGAAL